jgi:hypothetical protein
MVRLWVSCTQLPSKQSLSPLLCYTSIPFPIFSDRIPRAFQINILYAFLVSIILATICPYLKAASYSQCRCEWNYVLWVGPTWRECKPLEGSLAKKLTASHSRPTFPEHLNVFDFVILTIPDSILNDSHTRNSIRLFPYFMRIIKLFSR